VFIGLVYRPTEPAATVGAKGPYGRNIDLPDGVHRYKKAVFGATIGSAARQ
jgi:hypothetical protein